MLSNMFEKGRAFLRGRRLAYIQTFNGVPAKTVLSDLAKFCRAHDTTMREDPRGHAILEGRRQVWLRIQQHLKLSDDQLWEIYTGRTINHE